MAQTAVSRKIEYVDVPAVSETFADTVQDMAFDGQTFRIQFCVTRMDEPKGTEGEITGKRYTTCRMVLSPQAALELSTKLGRVLSAMLKQGASQKATQEVAKKQTVTS